MPSTSRLADLRQTLHVLDGKGYKAYKRITGRYDADTFTLIVDHVQGDPFGAPSRLRVQMPHEQAGFPRELFETKVREIALRDVLTRIFGRGAAERSQTRGSGGSGRLSMDRPGQEVLERTSVVITDELVEARFTAGLPAKGRTILGRAAAEMLCEIVPELVRDSLVYEHLWHNRVREHVSVVEDAHALREQLAEKGLVAFVADEAMLPRRSGIDDRPLENAVPFASPESLRVTLDRPNAGPLSGMGIPQGVTLIVGGGYHGKTTLLKAIERGVYNHIPRDGREFVVTDLRAVKIRAEDGRSVSGVNIAPFITHLPQERSTESFSTPDASGSTSQAANIMEALEAGARLLLMDEDTSATNFMIRDQRMQELIAKDREPITPYIDKVRQLAAERDVSTLVVLGGSGDYLDRADTVIAMDTYRPRDVTGQAREIAQRYATGRRDEGGERFGEVTSRIPHLDQVRFRKQPDKPAKIKVPDVRSISIGTQTVDMSCVEQLVDPSQGRAIARAILRLAQTDEKQATLAERLDAVERDIAREGLDRLTNRPEGDSAAFRRFELAAAINRLRAIRMDVPSG